MSKETLGIPKPGKQYAPKRPTRDEFVLEEIANQLTEAKQEDAEVVLTVWGVQDPVQGRISEMDSRTGKIHVVKQYGDLEKFPFMDIMKVEYPT